jgi:Arc/MetJ-type ribon-helix-helix transcriptional regulator
MPKVKKTVTIDANLLAWVERQINDKRFASISHAIEYALYKTMKEEPGRLSSH